MKSVLNGPHIIHMFHQKRNVRLHCFIALDEGELRPNSESVSLRLVFLCTIVVPVPVRIVGITYDNLCCSLDMSDWLISQ